MPISNVAKGLYSEALIEAHFGLSVSKLRSGQRIRYLQASTLLGPDRRHHRVWSRSETAKAWYASEIANCLQIPFLAACDGVRFYNEISGADSAWGSVEPIEYPVSNIMFYDRQFLTYRTSADDRERQIGRIIEGQDGRHLFVPDQEFPIPVEWTCRYEVDNVRVRLAFLELLAKVEKVA